MMERRQFLRCAVAGVGAAMVGGGWSRALAGEPQLERRNERPGMAYARLGRTNLAVSRIVHGSLQTNRDRIPLLARLYDAGVNFYDTSHVYGDGRSEEAMGEFFADNGRRKNVFLCTKMDLRAQLKEGKGVYEKAMTLAEGSLRRLRTDHVDIMMLHGCTTLVDWVNNAEWLRAAEDLKKQGKIRFVGISEHARPAEVLKLAAAGGRYDVAMVAFSLVKGEWGSLGRSDTQTMDPALKAAREKDLGVVAIKAALRAEEIVAKVSDPTLKKKGYSAYQLCYRYVLSVPGVHAVTCGMTTLAHVAENVAVPSIELAARDVDHLRQVAAASGVCGFCGTCLDACPGGVAIQDILRFHGYWTHGRRAAARAEYAALSPPQQVATCRDCGRCEAACPGRVRIRLRLREAHAALA
jgi:aryl-alcohol dehydrogenase-like predicted oxidoreductase